MVNDLNQPLVDRGNLDGDPYTGSGFWSIVTFSWLNPLLEKGHKGKLKTEDIPRIPETETAEKAFALFQDSFPDQTSGGIGSVARAIACFSWRSVAINAIFAGLYTIASYIGPFLITHFVNSLSIISQSSSSCNQGLILASIFFFAKSVESLSQRHCYFGSQRVGIRVRAALTVLIYKKSLAIKSSAPSNGKVVNFITSDIEKVVDLCLHLHEVWLLPIQVLLALTVFYINLGGIPSLVALVTTVLVMVSNTPLAKRQKKHHSAIMEAKDTRIKATSETLKSIRVLKLHSWETKFMGELLKLRLTERSWLQKYLYTQSAVAFLFWASTILVSVCTFGACVLLKISLTPARVFSTLATIKILQDPIYNLPELISLIAQTKVALERIERFIKEEDAEKLATNESTRASDVGIEIEAGEYSWDENSGKKSVEITDKVKIIKANKVAICGSVGSGKSSLLCSMLGEISRISGTKIEVYGSKAYVPQSVWIQSGTVRDNVLFGKKMDGQLYESVLRACALERDVGNWVNGDMSLVGERGLKMSGGQKQRIQLSRAIYGDSDVYFLDDPFSAVDAVTGAHLFNECITGILSSKTVVYVTHQLEFLHASDLVLVMKDGQIVQSGKYEDLMKDPQGELVRLMAEHVKSIRQVSTLEQNGSTTQNPYQRDGDEVIEDDSFHLSEANVSETNHEETETGSVKWLVYSTFLTSAYGGALVPVVLLCQILFQGLQMGSSYWMAWATEEEGRVKSDKLFETFVLFSVGSCLFMMGRTVLLSCIALKTAQNLFVGMITSVFKAPMSFFDCTPSSQILNRSSTDQGTVDTDIPYRLAGLAFALIQLFSIIFLMCLASWQVSVLFLAILGVSMWYQGYYIATARETARMMGTRRAPIIQHFTESISGGAIIRCFDQEQMSITKCFCLVDEYSGVVFHNTAAMEWVSVRVNFLFNLAFFVVLIILVTFQSSNIGPSLAGLIATYGLNLNVLLEWVIWNRCNVENKMISVERLLQFTKLPSEAPSVIEGHRPEPTWPTRGRIELKNLHIQYKPDLPMVLKGITCSIPGGNKIGIVGRTGCGKSTLIQALFRVVEPCEGEILIDGVDISSIGLQDLRSRMSVIPQDPVLFQGTIRSNIDPLQHHSDHEIWEVLRKCNLKEIAAQDQRLLDVPVAEDGGNWSVGQRQLLCLARMLIQKRRILVLDEATASVDTATENVIQKAIREETEDFTVIIVAHRVPSVIDSDLVLVLHDGRILEYDSPTKLLEDKSSAFAKMVMEFTRRSNNGA